MKKTSVIVGPRDRAGLQTALMMGRGAWTEVSGASVQAQARGADQ